MKPQDRKRLDALRKKLAADGFRGWRATSRHGGLPYDLWYGEGDQLGTVIGNLGLDVDAVEVATFIAAAPETMQWLIGLLTEEEKQNAEN
jgi:hypothetical protein